MRIINPAYRQPTIILRESAPQPVAPTQNTIPTWAWVVGAALLLIIIILLTRKP